MSTCDEESSPVRFGLKRSDAMDFNALDTMTFGTLKSEDSGIVLVNGLQSPDDETKEIVPDRTLSTKKKSKAAAGDVIHLGGDGIVTNGGSRRRSSTETYSSGDEDDDIVDEDTRRGSDQGRAAGDGGEGKTTSGGAWLSDDDGQGKDVMENVVVETESGGEDQPSVGSSPGGDKDDSTSPEPPKIERPKVEFRKGIRCNDVMRAVEILLTSYRLPDIATRDNHYHWSAWGSSDYGSRSYLRARHQYEIPEGSKELREICQSIERRHREIAEMLRLLLEQDAANRAEADALFRLSVTSANNPAGDGCYGSPGVGPISAAAAVNPYAAAIDADGQLDMDATDPSSRETGVSASRSLKRRNPFTRAVHAIRKRFSGSRPHQHDESVPVAA